MNIKLDANGDWDVQNGDLQFTVGKEEISQIIAQRLKTVLGEWFLNVDLGLPYFDSILVKNVDLSVIEALIRNEILNCPGVIDIEEFTMDIDKARRELSVDCRINSVEGIIDFTEVLT